MKPSHKVKLGTLYQKKSAAGAVYFVGRLGAARVLLLRDQERAEDGTPKWNLVLEAVEDRPRQAAEGQDRPARPAARRPARRKPAAPAKAAEPFISDDISDLWAAG